MLLAQFLPSFRSLPLLPTSTLCPFSYWFPNGWACVHSRIPRAPPTDSPVRPEVSPTSATPTGFYARGFEALVSCTETLSCRVCLAPQLFLLAYPMQMWNHQSAWVSLLLQLPISALPTNVDECYFFNSLVVRLPYNLIFWQFWGFFVCLFLNWLLSCFCLREEVKCTYLCLYLGQKPPK